MTILKKIDKSTNEKIVETYLVMQVKAMGGEAYKFTSPQRRFVPDRICVFPGNLVIFVECKSKTGKLSPGQIREIDKLLAMNQYAVVLSSKQEVDQFIQTAKDTIENRMKVFTSNTEKETENADAVQAVQSN